MSCPHVLLRTVQGHMVNVWCEKRHQLHPRDEQQWGSDSDLCYSVFPLWRQVFAVGIFFFLEYRKQSIYVVIQKRQGRRNMIHALNAILWLCHSRALIFYLCVCIYADLPTQGVYYTVLACSLRMWFSPRCLCPYVIALQC